MSIPSRATLVALLALVAGATTPVLATPPRSPISLNLKVIGIEAGERSGEAVLEVVSVLPSPDTTVTLLLPEGMEADRTQWALNLEPGIPVGHPPLLLWRKTDGQVRAFRENGDRLLLYTDGITEAENAVDEQFGEERLFGFIAANGALPAGRFADLLLAELAAWSGASGGAQRDDVTLIVVDLVC